MKQAIRILSDELDTVGFVIGYGLIVYGVAQLSAVAAYILAGLLLCVGSALVALGRRS